MNMREEEKCKTHTMYNIMMNSFMCSTHAIHCSKKKTNKKKQQPKSEKGTGPYEQTDKHIDFIPLSLVHVRRNRQFVLLKKLKINKLISIKKLIFYVKKNRDKRVNL
jgi:hypothetical protein